MYYRIVYIAWENVDERGKKMGSQRREEGKRKKVFHRTGKSSFSTIITASERERGKSVPVHVVVRDVKHKHINWKKRSHDRRKFDRIVIYLKLGFSDMEN
jgi:hypothetical protein